MQLSRIIGVVLGIVGTALCFSFLVWAEGYTDTPLIPGTKWHVNGSARPQPPVVTPGRNPGDPPSDAIILFNGKDLSEWKSTRGGPAKWKVENGYMEVRPGTGAIETKRRFGNCQLHLEWAEPKNVRGSGQGRGNSGLFLMGLYEIQVLDSYKNKTYADGMAAAIYGQYPPLVNASRPPGQWQTYDIVWIAPKFDKGGKLLRPAYVTVFFNGILVHYNTPLYGPTGHKRQPKYWPHPPTGPIQLQDHGNPVRFRNIWCRPLKGYDGQPEWKPLEITPIVVK